MSDPSKSREFFLVVQRRSPGVLVLVGGQAARRHWTRLVNWQGRRDAGPMRGRAIAAEDPRDAVLRCHSDKRWN